MAAVSRAKAPTQQEGGKVSARGYVLINADVGKAKAVTQEMAALSSEEASVAAVDAVTGPYDVVVELEADNLNKLGSFVTRAIQKVAGVRQTTTCICVRL
jgi:DNA-binding Lrp family transcriptional regulator